MSIYNILLLDSHFPVQVGFPFYLFIFNFVPYQLQMDCGKHRHWSQAEFTSFTHLSLVQAAVYLPEVLCEELLANRLTINPDSLPDLYQMRWTEIHKDLKNKYLKRYHQIYKTNASIAHRKYFIAFIHPFHFKINMKVNFYTELILNNAKKNSFETFTYFQRTAPSWS